MENATARCTAANAKPRRHCMFIRLTSGSSGAEWLCGIWGREADSLTGMTDRKARTRTGLAFVVPTHPAKKRGMDGAPTLVVRMGKTGAWVRCLRPDAEV